MNLCEPTNIIREKMNEWKKQEVKSNHWMQCDSIELEWPFYGTRSARCWRDSWTCEQKCGGMLGFARVCYSVNLFSHLVWSKGEFECVMTWDFENDSKIRRFKALGNKPKNTGFHIWKALILCIGASLIFFKYLSVGMWLTGLPMDIIIRAHVIPTKAAEFETTLILKYWLEKRKKATTI